MTAQTILPANSVVDSGFNVANSVRFTSGDYLDHTHGAVTSTRKQTYSVWVKRGKLSAYGYIIATRNGTDTNRDGIAFSDADQIDIRYNAGNSSPIRLTTNRLFRDASAWYHIVVAVDTTQGTAANRIKLYVNGVQETSFATSNYMDQNYDFALNAKTDQTTDIGNDTRSDGAYFDGYLSEFVVLDGSQNAPTDFGEADEDSGIWKPIDPSGLTFGNAGFYMNFQTAAELGTDVSGNSNTFSENGIVAADQSTDTCTNNFATLNPLWASLFDNDGLISKGNCKGTFTAANADRGYLMTTMGVSAGKWYWEAKVIDKTRMYIGIAKQSVMTVDEPFYDETTYNALAINNAGEFYGRYTGSAIDQFDTSVSTDNNNILGFALDRDNKALYIHKNGTYINSGDPTSGASRTGCLIDELAASRDLYIPDNEFIFPFMHDPSTSGQLDIEYNFGGSPAFAISSGNADGNGFGNFEYAVPSGYFSLCTKNLGSDGG